MIKLFAVRVVVESICFFLDLCPFQFSDVLSFIHLDNFNVIHVCTSHTLVCSAHRRCYSWVSTLGIPMHTYGHTHAYICIEHTVAACYLVACYLVASMLTHIFDTR